MGQASGRKLEGPFPPPVTPHTTGSIIPSDEKAQEGYSLPAGAASDSAHNVALLQSCSLSILTTCRGDLLATAPGERLCFVRREGSRSQSR